MTACRLATAAGTADVAEPGRYERLGEDGRRLVREWFTHAVSGRSNAGAGSFESFVFLWIAFNGWAACITGEDGDTAWRDALITDRGVCGSFDRLLADSRSRAHGEASHFRGLWPIFRVEELRRLKIDDGVSGDLARPDRAAALFAAGAHQFEPRCWYDHGEHAPADWAHTVSALHRVRCNLFHGEKALNSENDQRIVQAAYATLAALLEESGYLA